MHSKRKKSRFQITKITIIKEPMKSVLQSNLEKKKEEKKKTRLNQYCEMKIKLHMEPKYLLSGHQ